MKFSTYAAIAVVALTAACETAPGGTNQTTVTQTPPPAQAAPAAPARPAPAAPQNYIVFFDFDKSDITTEARTILERAATTLKAGSNVAITVTGHADRSGSDAYNQRLSLRRARAVEQSLVRLGIPQTRVSVVAKGESVPLVPTADGVREPQNRRVEITY